MKQSTKLLSLFLAMLMVFSCFSVAVNAASYKANVITNPAYDSHDDAILTPEQCATLACDMIDQLLEGTDLYDEIDAVVTKIQYDIRSIDNLGQTANGIKGLWNTLKVLAGDASELDVSELAKLSRSSGSGDYAVFEHLFKFLSTTKHINLIKEAVGGINKSGGLDLGGLIGLFLKDEDLEGVNQYLGSNLAPLVNGLVYDALLYGSYDFPTKWDDLATKPANADTLDEILNTALVNLLTDPQDFEYVDPDDDPETDDSYKVWDENSRILTPEQVTAQFGSEANLASQVEISSHSILGVLDNVLQAAYEAFGVHGLNISLKQIIMDAMEVDFEELSYNELPANIQSAFGTEKVNPNYSSYAFEDYMLKGTDGNWYYTKVERREVRPATEEDDGTERIRTYYVADLTTGNALVNLINWDYEFTADDFDFNALVAQNGSIFGCLNHILYVILDKAVGSNVKVFNYGDKTYSKVSDLWTDGGNTNLQANLISVVKAVLKTYTSLLFGKSHEYVDAKTGKATAAFAAVVNDGDLVDLVEYIGLPFFKDAMPQLVLPTANDDTDYVFDDGVQVLEFGAIVIREFLTDITPNVNYDSYIFEAGSLNSATGRKMNGANTAEAWINIVLNMGLDLAYTLLKYQTNFSLDIPAAGVTAERWQGMADAIISWGANYVSYNGNSIIDAFDPAKINAIEGPFNKISYVLNTLLPLGFINGCSTANYDFDVQYFFDNVLKPVVTNLDLSALFSLFGRNTNSKNNILTTTNIGGVVIDLANSILKLVTGTETLVKGTGATTINNALTVANLKTTVGNLLTGLGNRYNDILKAGLPVAAKFVKGWATENNVDYVTFKDVDDNYTTNNADIYLTVNCASEGLWRGYNGAKAEEMYSYKITDKYLEDMDGAKDTNFSVATGYRTYPFNTAPTFTANDTIQFGSTQMFFRITGAPNTASKMMKAVVKYDIYKGATKIGSDYIGESKWFCISAPKAEGVQTNILAAEYRHFSTSLISYDNYGYTDIFSPYYVDIANATAETITGKKVYNCNWGGTNANYQGAITVAIANGAATQYGISFDLVSGVHNAKSDPINKNFKVNMDTFTASVKSGDVASWTLDASMASWNGKGSYQNKCKINKTDTDKNGDVKIYFYNSEEKAKFKDAVNKYLDKNLKSAMYTADSWNVYYNALKTAVYSAYGEVNAAYSMNYAALETALDNAYEALVKKGSTPAVTAPTAVMNAIDAADEVYGNKGYTDYALNRWDHYKAVYNDANNYVNNYKKATEEIEDSYWSFNSSVKGSEVSAFATAAVGSANAKYINALVEDYDTETLEKLTEDKAKAADSFNNMRKEKVDDYVYRLPLEISRLNLRATAPNDGKAYLQTEVNSAKAQFTSKGAYTDRSWSRYTAALAAAETALASNSNAVMFDAKYELLCARNELKTAAEEADYTQLEELIKQANGAIANRDSYENLDPAFSDVYAALGTPAVTDAEGNKVQLFPNAAVVVNENSYAADDQKKVDRAADALRKALAKLKFKTVETGATEVTVGEDAEGNEIKVETKKLLKNKKAADVVKEFTVAGSDSTNVSVNGTYALNSDAALAGTGSTVTFFKNVSGVKVPMATVTIVVDGDVNGDGAVDVLDATVVELVANNHAELSGIYFVAGNLDTASEGIIAQDYSNVIAEVLK